MSDRLLVVVGATGSQGRAVVSFFQQREPTWRIRGLTRNPSSDTAKALAASGVEVVKADLSDVDALKVAFRGANYIFAYTDFGGILRSVLASRQASTSKAELSMGEEAARIEAQHGRNIADAAAGVPELERLVWSGLSDAKRLSRGKYTGLWNFEGKAEVTEYMFSLPALEGKVRVVHMGAFLETIFKKRSLFGFRVLPDKTAEWTLNWSKAAKVPWVDVEKDTGAFVKALIDATAKTQILGVSDWLSCEEFIALWTKATGHEGWFKENDREHYFQDDATGMKAAFAKTGDYFVELGYDGGDLEILSPDELEKAQGLSIPRTNIENFMSRQDWAKILG